MQRSDIKLVKFKPLDQPKTSIIATIKEHEKYSKEYISELIEKGMNIAGINLSHVNGTGSGLELGRN